MVFNNVGDISYTHKFMHRAFLEINHRVTLFK